MGKTQPSLESPWGRGSPSKALPSAHRIWARPGLRRMGWGGAGPLLMAGGGRVLWVRPEGPDPSRRPLLLATEEDEREHLGWSGRRTWAGLVPRVGLCLGQQGCIPEQVLPRASLGAFHGDQRAWMHEVPAPGIRLSLPFFLSFCLSLSLCHILLSLCLCLTHSLLAISPSLFTSHQCPHPPQFPSGSRASQEGLAG